MGSCNKIPQAEELTKKQKFFASEAVLKAESPRSRCRHGQVKAFSWFIAGAFSLYPYVVEQARELSGVSFTRALGSFMKVPP